MRTESLKTVYRVPLILSIFTVGGLLSALLGDGLWDAFSWVLLAIPISLLSFFLLRPN
jgi:hypothetical protein